MSQMFKLVQSVLNRSSPQQTAIMRVSDILLIKTKSNAKSNVTRLTKIKTQYFIKTKTKYKYKNLFLKDYTMI